MNEILAVAPMDVAYLRGLEGTLSEWDRPADEQAFADL
jgi:antitoxin PrlF